MRTLDARLRQHERSALEVARWVAEHPAIARVLHPALPSDPGHGLWKRDFLGSTGLFGVELKPCSHAQVAALLDGLECFALGYSWGGFDSIAVPANLKGARSVRPWEGGPLIRLQIGLEAPEDLIADLERGFAKMRAP
jgi:cystathionine beta-lyase